MRYRTIPVSVHGKTCFISRYRMSRFTVISCLNSRYKHVSFHGSFMSQSTVKYCLVSRCKILFHFPVRTCLNSRYGNASTKRGEKATENPLSRANSLAGAAGVETGRSFGQQEGAGGPLARLGRHSPALPMVWGPNVRPWPNEALWWPREAKG